LLGNRFIGDDNDEDVEAEDADDFVGVK